MLLQLAALEAVAVLLATSSALDDTADRIVLYGAATAVLFGGWRVIKRVAKAAEYLESLPTIDGRLEAVENRVEALAREMGVTARDPDRRR